MPTIYNPWSGKLFFSEYFFNINFNFNMWFSAILDFHKGCILYITFEQISFLAAGASDCLHFVFLHRQCQAGTHYAVCFLLSALVRSSFPIPFPNPNRILSEIHPIIPVHYHNHTISFIIILNPFHHDYSFPQVNISLKMLIICNRASPRKLIIINLPWFIINHWLFVIWLRWGNWLL